MKKNLVVTATLLFLQIAILFGGIWLSISLRSDCSLTSDQFGMWQCTTNTDPITAPLIAFIILPPLFAKFILAKLGHKISWKRLVITHAIVAVLVWGTLNYLDSPNCGCGGA